LYFMTENYTIQCAMEKTKTVLEIEIGEQPEAIARTLDSCGPAVDGLCSDIQRREISYVLLAARGSSDNAGTYAKYLFSSFNGWPVVQSTPSLYTFYHTPPRLKNAFVLGISQSGQSEDIVEVLADARRQGALTASITADASSPLARTSDHVLLLQTGMERAVAATKTFTCSLALLADLSATLQGDGKKRQALRDLPQQATRTIDIAGKAASARAERYRYMDRCVVIGRGFSYGIALEVALKLKELTYVTADPYSSADFLHGPMAMIEHGFPAVLVAPSGTLLQHMKEFSAQLAERGSEILAISDSEEILAFGLTRFPLPQGLPEWLSPILAVIPGQLLGLHLAAAKGLDPDAPRGLRKVTVTR
jgi:glucosamine--fructose-6-phosphate aminotransferase (isomerizing)